MEIKLLTNEKTLTVIGQALAEYDQSGDFWHCIDNVDVNVFEWEDDKGRPELRVVAYPIQHTPIITIMDRWQILARIPLSSDDDNHYKEGRT